MKKISLVLIIVLTAALASFSTAFAQAESLQLTITRDWGYGGFNGDIQGTFSMKVSGPPDLVRVEFFIDGMKIGEANKAPFNLQFNTDHYAAGTHVLSAVGTTTGGSRLGSNKFNPIFISAEDSNKKMLTMVIPILAVAFGLILLSALISMFTANREKGVPYGFRRSYPLGGGICPNCSRPFAFQLFSMNMVVGKLVSCPHCGKWSLVRYAPLEKLRSAEDAELTGEKGQNFQSGDQEKLKKELDDSKYQDF